MLGDGPLRPKLEAQIAESGLTDAVELAGIVSDVERHLNDANLFLLTSEFEGLPLSVLEAMSCGLPVVSTRSGGTVDIVSDQTGILTDVYDIEALTNALCKLAEDNSLRADLSEAAIQFASDFDISACVDRYAELFGLNESQNEKENA